MSYLAANLARFAGLLRRAGVRVGSGQVIDATAALAAVGLDRRGDVFAALRATLVCRREDLDLFARAFDLFFRDRDALNQALAMLLPMARAPESAGDRSRRIDEAQRRPRPTSPREAPAVREVQMAIIPSTAEVDRRLDFEQMSAAEMAAAERAVARIALLWARRETRRWRVARAGSRLDLRRTLHRSARHPDGLEPVWSSRRRRPPPLVILADVSGSMERYSRLFLHFAHAVASARPRVSVFVFGTQLTSVTRALRHRDVDIALARIAAEVSGARGGTRIGRCLHQFNSDWSRRTVTSSADVLFLSDGLERDREHDLGAEAERLARSCRRLIWLNPLLRYAQFEPKASGVRALLPHADQHRPVHNLASIEQLAAALSFHSASRNRN